ncbi:MAG: hypothetical protein IPL81_14560 [Flavobacteriales bacterium]|nr:hypothetical protein [Flavobacteriales bacterium]
MTRLSQEAHDYLVARRLVRYLDICDGNMEECSLRCDANISLLRPRVPRNSARAPR